MNNFTIYTLPRAVYDFVTAQLLKPQRDEFAHLTRPLTDLELTHLGFDTVMGWSDDCGVHTDVVLSERVLPSEVVRLKLAAKVRAIETGQGRRVGNRERHALREEVLHDLIPQAPVRTTRVHLYLTSTLEGDDLVCIGTAKPAVAEGVLSLLRKEFDSFPALPPDSSMAELYLNEALIELSGMKARRVNNADCPFTLGARATLQEPGGKAKARFTDIPLSDDDVIAHLRGGMRVTRLELCSEYGSFELDKQLVVRNLRLADMEDEAREMIDERWAEQADAVLLCAALRAKMLLLFGWMGTDSPLASAREAA